MVFGRTVIAAMLAGALVLAPATSKADDGDAYVWLITGIGMFGIFVVGLNFDEVDVREAPQVRLRNEFRAGRPGVATEWAMTPAVGVGVWRGVGRERGAPTMMFLRMRY